MTNQQLADRLLQQWQVLWHMQPADRIKRIEQIEEELRFEEKLARAARELAR